MDPALPDRGSSLPPRPDPDAPARSPLRLRWLRLRTSPVAWWLAVGLVVAVTAVGAVRTDADARARRASWGDASLVPVLLADVDAGVVLSASHLDWVERPQATLPQTPAASDPVGRRTTIDLVAGEVVLEARLAGADAGPLGALLADDEVAVGVPDLGTGLAVAAGDRVEVLVTLDRGADGPPTFVVTTLGRVLALDDEGATVAVPRSVAPKVAHGVVAGVVTLALRG